MQRAEEPPKPEAPPSLVGPGTLEAMLTLARQAPPGPFLEVGVYKGGSAWHLGQLALEQGRELWLYDTFTGIPYQGPNDVHRVGDFADTDYHAVKRAIPHAHVVMGLFPQSAQFPGFFPRQSIAFAHLDCDQERSYREALRYLVPHMAKGGVMWFDDAPCLKGAELAVRAHFAHELQLDDTHGRLYAKF